jgi:hypothetical protein
MKNREQLRQKGHKRSQKTTCRERGKKYDFQKGEGGKISFSDQNIDPCSLYIYLPIMISSRCLGSLCIRAEHFVEEPSSSRQ